MGHQAWAQFLLCPALLQQIYAIPEEVTNPLVIKAPEQYTENWWESGCVGALQYTFSNSLC